ncbi:hypothetical protein [Acinetobacter baumannii]|uniref:hypothetical protein n=1 Tax=Acinetobacter baumannii TaxID=470 RepID=UPI0011145665|nr:hypothetical protein [Acinetobacter baumannii]
MTIRSRRYKRKKDEAKFTSFQSLMIKGIAIVLSINVFMVSYAAYVVDGGDGTARVGMSAALQTIQNAITDNFTKVMNFFDVQMAAMDSLFASTFKLSNETTTSAMKVLVKQSSLSANLLSENIVNNAQQQASIIQAENQKKRIIDANEKYGLPAQGHKVCTVLAERTEITKAVAGNKKAVPSVIGETVYASAGSFGNPQEVMQKMNDDHSSLYCTPEQSASGYCDRVSDQAGWDLMTSTLFTPTVEGTAVYAAQNALINNMVGLPDAALPKGSQLSPSSSNYLDAKQNKDALISPAIYSLKSIQAEFTGMATTESGGAISPLKAIDDQVKRYLGSGPEYQDWNKTLVVASESGVMKEILQISALRLHLLQRKYFQQEREEMVLAGLVASTQKLLEIKTGNGTFGTVSASENAKIKSDAQKISRGFASRNYN